MRLSAVFVCLGAWISGYFIVVTDAWMQHPVGYALAANGTVKLTSLWLVLTNSFCTMAVCARPFGSLGDRADLSSRGVGAFYLLSNRDEAYGREFVRAGVLCALVFSAITIFPTGDRNGADVTTYQPVKLAAMEGLFDSTKDAPLAIIGMPDVKHQNLIDPVLVPDLLSFLAYGNFRANVAGLSSYSADLRPPGGSDVLCISHHGRAGDDLHCDRGARRFAPLSRTNIRGEGKADALASDCWQYLFLISRMNAVGPFQKSVASPWIVYGLMRTSAGISSNVNAGETLFTLIGFAGMYFLLGFLFLFIVLREIGHGPAVCRAYEYSCTRLACGHARDVCGS